MIRKGDETGNIATPNGAVVATISAETLAIISEPNSGSMIFSAREQKVAVAIVFEKSQRPLVAFHQYWPHLSGSDLCVAFSSVFLLICLHARIDRYRENKQMSEIKPQTTPPPPFTSALSGGFTDPTRLLSSLFIIYSTNQIIARTTVLLKIILLLLIRYF